MSYLAIVLSVLLRFTDSDYPFGIFKLFLDNFITAATEIYRWFGNFFHWSKENNSYKNDIKTYNFKIK